MLTYVRALRWMRIGFLPAAGGWSDQAARLAAALEVLISEEQRQRDY